MQKHLAIGRGVKILDQKNQGFNDPPPPASLRVKDILTVPILIICIQIFVLEFRVTSNE